MGLIKCPDCGKEFSDRISACPNCSCPIEEAKKEAGIKETKKKVETIKGDMKPIKEVIENKSNNSYDKKYRNVFKIINLYLLACTLSIALCQGNGNVNLDSLLTGVVNFAIASLTFLLIPALIILVFLPEKSQKKHKKSLIIGSLLCWIILVVLHSCFVLNGSVQEAFEYVGFSFWVPILYYYINKWIYLKEYFPKRNPISIIFFIILSLLLILTVVSSITHEDSNEEYMTTKENYLL